MCIFFNEEMRICLSILSMRMYLPPTLDEHRLAVCIRRRFELPASRWNLLVDRAISSLEDQQQLRAGRNGAATAPKGATNAAGTTESADAPVATSHRAVYVPLIDAPRDLLLLGLRSWASALGNGGRRWSAAQLLAALPPALAKLEQGAANAAESQEANTSHDSFQRAIYERKSASDKNSSPADMQQSGQPRNRNAHLGRDCVALQLLVALILDELTGRYSNSLPDTGEGQSQHLPLLNQKARGDAGLLPLLFRSLSPSFGGYIASTVYAEVRYSFYFQREAREAAAAESEDAIPMNLSM